ncbi:MAG: adenosine deaminase [Clostridia bacterium]|nr:adenosine deaminase [Clostridia bacterium]
MELYNKFYLDKEKDIIINLYRKNADELEYILETPNHKTGNLITNLAKICNVQTVKNEKDMKIIKGVIPASINADNEEVYIFRLGGIKIANIYNDGRIELKAQIPAINKTLMSQTKDYKIDVSKTIIKTYIMKKNKFRTDLHTHIHANLNSDVLIALGIKHQIKYSLYYIKKLGLKLSDKQAKEMFEKRCEIEKKYAYCDLPGKRLTRKIDDETFINFADLILNNKKNMEENIAKIRNSLVLMKDGQAVFTNLEKLYIYRYAFSKGQVSENKIEIEESKVDSITEKDIKRILKTMLEDSKKEEYRENSLLQDKLLWVARQYQRQGISYAEISVTWIVRKGEEGAKILKELHEIMPRIEADTGVKLRFLGSLSRTLMTEKQLKEGVDVLKVAAKSPYIVGSDIIGEEINDIRNFKQVIKELVEFAVKEDNGFTIRIHAGENDSFKENVQRAVDCVKNAVPEGAKMPKCRIGHGLYGIDLETVEGIALMNEMKKDGIVLEFQLTSNVRLNNLTKVEEHPIKKYLSNGVSCLQGSDGCGFYGTDCMEEQMALTNLLNLTEDDLLKIRKVEDKIISDSDKYFKIKSEKFGEWLNGRDIKDAILEEELKEIKLNEDREFKILGSTNIDSEEILKEKIVKLPDNKVPIIVAGGSFNSKGRETVLDEKGKEILKELMQKLNNEKVYFVIGHKMQGYEKAIIDISKELGKKFEIDAIIPKKISKEVGGALLLDELDGVCISTEQEELGIYKSFNYEIFERRGSIVIAFDGNSPVSNLIQEAKNGKGKAKIYVYDNVKALQEKAKSLEGYVTTFSQNKDIIKKIALDNPEIMSSYEEDSIYKVIS